MTDLTHDTEVEVLSTERSSMQEVSDEVDNCVKNFESLGEGTQASLEAEPDTPRPELSDVQNDRPLFFVDTDPSLDDKELSGPSYEAVSAEPLGSSASQQSDEETIVFLPRTYRHPQSISILNPNPVTSPSPIKPSPIILPAIEQRPRNKVSIRSGPAQRKEKHSTKCDTRGRKKKSRRHRVIEGSDIEWGSDGPPGMILGVEGENDGGGSEDNEEAGEDSMAVLRDYLEGTLLNAKSEWREREERIGSEKDSEASEHRARELKTRSEERGEKGEEFIGELVGEQDMEVEASEDSEGDWESSSDSRGPPDQADIKSALEAADTGSDEDMEKEAGFFAGRNSWGDTNWFIRNMEVN